MLMTSACEGFPCVVAESKSVGTPVVCYELPYIDGLTEEHGVVSVPQMDCAAAAEATVKLLQDCDYHQKMRLAARRSYERLRDYDFKAAYTRLFQVVLKGAWLQEAYSAQEYQLALRTLASHAGVAVDRLRSWRFIFKRAKSAMRVVLSHPGCLVKRFSHRF